MFMLAGAPRKLRALLAVLVAAAALEGETVEPMGRACG